MEKRLPRIKALLTPGEVAKRSGVAVSALHFYESKGLIKSIRNGGNQRRYTRDVLRYVAIIKIAQRIGIPLATIGEAFGVLPEGHTLSPKEWKELSSQWREELDRRIHTHMARMAGGGSHQGGGQHQGGKESGFHQGSFSVWVGLYRIYIYPG